MPKMWIADGATPIQNVWPHSSAVRNDVNRAVEVPHCGQDLPRKRGSLWVAGLRPATHRQTALSHSAWTRLRLAHTTHSYCQPSKEEHQRTLMRVATAWAACALLRANESTVSGNCSSSLTEFRELRLRDPYATYTLSDVRKNICPNHFIYIIHKVQCSS